MTDLYIKELNIKAFGKFVNKKIILDKEFNLIYGLNESGKSTLKNFIEGMFYGFDEGKQRISFSSKREIYRPKDAYIYAGSLIIYKGGENFRLDRDFDSGAYKIYNLSKGLELDTKASDLAYPGKYFLNLDYDLYQNFISSYQMQVTSVDSKKKVIEKLASKDIDYNFSIKSAIEILDKKQADLGTERAYTKPYYKIKEKITDIKDILNEIGSLKAKFRKDFQSLDINREKLQKLEEKYKKLKDENEIFNSLRSDQNYKDYKKWADKLYELDQDLKKYEDLKSYRSEDFEDIEFNHKDQSSIKYIYVFYILLLIIIGLSIFTKNFYLLLFIIPTLFFLFKDKKEKVEPDFIRLGVNNLAEYNRLRMRFLKYKSLLEEKEKIEEVLTIIKKQDLTALDPNLEYNFDFESYDNVKAREDINSLEEEIKNLKSFINAREKELLLIDAKLKKEVDYKDELKYLEGKFQEIIREKEAISLAKDTILAIADENKNDMAKLNRKINSLIASLGRNNFKISYDPDLNIDIRDKNLNSFDLNQLSQGFFDQLNLALKLNLVNESFGQVFMIFDDAFINYDIERLIKFLFILLDMARDKQILYFTCHRREEEFFLSENIEVKVIHLEDRWYMLSQTCI